ncbi:MAG: MATE family efflux transporter [Candidatus Delongbacteria bacterium]|nr:MATE family efflux transporter [Candidatus Delongbacteria bacterium]
MSKLTKNDVKTTLVQMAFPMLAGTIAMNTYNLVDTWFVSKLGTIPLAAMGFTFPVVTLLTFIAGGIGSGITTLTSHAIGRGDKPGASRTVTHGVVLITMMSVCLLLIGYLSIVPVFSQLGADSRTLPLVMDYMKTWYMGAVFMAIPMMGNGILISLGDSKMASRFMVFGALINCILDPILIFGWLGLPALGILGAALATVIGQAVSSCWLFYLLSVRYPLLRFRRFMIRDFIHSCRRILGFGIPGSISMMLMPLASAVITALISRYGNEAVAGVSAASRVEIFAFIVPMALGMSLIPFISQNFGAGRMDRIRQAKIYAIRFAFLYGAGIAILFFLAAPLLARVFTRDPQVSEIFVIYIRIIAWGYGMMEIHRYCTFLFTGMHHPVLSTLLNAFRILGLLIPLSFLGSHWGGINGIFFGRLVTDWTAGIIGYIWVSRMLTRHK